MVRVHAPESASRPGLSIVVPCYRSGEWLDELVDRVDKALKDVAASCELVLVDDASPDEETWAAIRRNAQHRPWVRGVSLQFNVGQFRALLAGLERAAGDLVITMDDDFQTPPEELPKLVRAAREHPEMDAIIGAYTHKRHSRLRNLGSRIMGVIYEQVYGKPRDLQTSSFRILKRGLVETICAHGTKEPVLGAIIVRSTHRLMNIPIEHEPRTRGRSGYTLSGLVGLGLNGLFSSSTAPLRLISALGILTAFASFGLGVAYAVEWARGRILEPGFTTLVLLITFLSGIILMSIGIIGEYVIRVVAEVSGAPRFIVREEIGGECARDPASDAAESSRPAAGTPGDAPA